MARQTGTKFVFSMVDGDYRTEQVKKALTYLRDAGLIIPVVHSASNGIPLGAETNSKFVKYIMVAKGGHVVPIEVKSGVKGSMKSLYELLSKPQKDIPYAMRCSLENFGSFVSPAGKNISICPLYAISNI